MVNPSLSQILTSNCLSRKVAGIQCQPRKRSIGKELCRLKKWLSIIFGSPRGASTVALHQGTQISSREPVDKRHFTKL
jgi:hypothetical protein